MNNSTELSFREKTFCFASDCKTETGPWKEFNGIIHVQHKRFLTKNFTAVEFCDENLAEIDNKDVCRPI